MRRMRETEDRIRQESMRAFHEKEARQNFQSLSVREYYAQKIRETDRSETVNTRKEAETDSSAALKDRIREVPRDKTPVVICGGSFNSDSHRTKMREAGKQLIESLLEHCDPENTCFIIGHRMCAYEKYLTDHNHGRFEIYAFVPSVLTDREIRKIRDHDVFVRIAIESAAMGLYKSGAYEIFKQRKSILIAMDGNSPAANMIQEANNAKYECRIFVDQTAKTLYAKAQSLEGYVTIFSETDHIAEKILKNIQKIQ